MSERLHVTGRGHDRASAMADADDKARAYWHDQAYVGEAIEASCRTTDMRNVLGEGRVIRTFEVEVVYRAAGVRL